jgi:hypothetical protein
MGLRETITRFFMGEEETRITRPGRNEPCRCGSGRKYKKCHLPEDENKSGKLNSIHCGKT